MKGVHVVQRILRHIPAALLLLSILVLSACATAAKPGEATITGGSASASRIDDGGWVFRTQPVPVPPPPEPKKEGPWVLILRPLPPDPKDFKDAIQTAPPENKP